MSLFLHFYKVRKRKQTCKRENAWITQIWREREREREREGVGPQLQ
ncbi:MAG: hypothetical protein N7Q72_05630 [Spiroplasma sp. Tabriz.8]|nr:hypothetical protein [Spiroplasma sp. Tabriz.8]